MTRQQVSKHTRNPTCFRQASQDRQIVVLVGRFSYGIPADDLIGIVVAKLVLHGILLLYVVPFI